MPMPRGEYHEDCQGIRPEEGWGNVPSGIAFGARHPSIVCVSGVSWGQSADNVNLSPAANARGHLVFHPGDP